MWETGGKSKQHRVCHSTRVHRFNVLSAAWYSAWPSSVIAFDTRRSLCTAIWSFSDEFLFIFNSKNFVNHHRVEGNKKTSLHKKQETSNTRKENERKREENNFTLRNLCGSSTPSAKMQKTVQGCWRWLLERLQLPPRVTHRPSDFSRSCTFPRSEVKSLSGMRRDQQTGCQFLLLAVDVTFPPPFHEIIASTAQFSIDECEKLTEQESWKCYAGDFSRAGKMAFDWWTSSGFRVSGDEWTNARFEYPSSVSAV